MINFSIVNIFISTVYFWRDFVKKVNASWVITHLAGIPTNSSTPLLLLFLLATKAQALEYEKSVLTPAAVETKGNIQNFFY